VLFVSAPSIASNPYYIFMAACALWGIGIGIFDAQLAAIVIASPSDHPKGAMTVLCSIYCWGAVGVTVITTLLLLAFGNDSWRWIMIGWLVVPITTFSLFCNARFPDPISEEEREGPSQLQPWGMLVIILLGISCGGAAEVGMVSWSSALAERGLGVKKQIGDIVGMGLFLALEASGRLLCSALERRMDMSIVNWLAFALTLACYLVVALQGNAYVALAAVAITGFTVSAP
jgi:hypothetical protein